MTFLVLKNKNSSDFFNDARTSTRSYFFASEFMYICDDFQFSVTRMNSTFYSVSKIFLWKIHTYLLTYLLTIDTICPKIISTTHNFYKKEAVFNYKKNSFY